MMLRGDCIQAKEGGRISPFHAVVTMMIAYRTKIEEGRKDFSIPC